MANTPTLRQCLACRQPFDRQTMIRLLFNRQTQAWQLFLPADGQDQRHSFGRSAYLCARHERLTQALRGKKLGKALKPTIPGAIVSCLYELLKGRAARG